MIALLTTEDDNPQEPWRESTFNRLGTDGKVIVRNATRRKVINAAADLFAPCGFHSGANDGGDDETD